MEITLKLSEDEAKALLGLMDLGVKAGGIQVAKAGAILNDKLQEAAKRANGEPSVILKDGPSAQA